MNGRYSVSDLMGRCYWQTDDMNDARQEAGQLVAIVGNLIIRDTVTGTVTHIREN